MRCKRTVLILVLMSLAASIASPIVTAQSYQNISAQEAKDRVESDPGIFVLDVRAASEYSSGHIEGAVNIPHDQIQARQNELPTDKGKEIIVYCKSGSRSSVASDTLVGLGFTNVKNMEGGYDAWQSLGTGQDGIPMDVLLMVIAVVVVAIIVIVAVMGIKKRSETKKVTETSTRRRAKRK